MTLDVRLPKIAKTLVPSESVAPGKPAANDHPRLRLRAEPGRSRTFLLEVRNPAGEWVTRFGPDIWSWCALSDTQVVLARGQREVFLHHLDAPGEDKVLFAEEPVVYPDPDVVYADNWMFSFQLLPSGNWLMVQPLESQPDQEQPRLELTLRAAGSGDVIARRPLPARTPGTVDHGRRLQLYRVFLLPACGGRVMVLTEAEELLAAGIYKGRLVWLGKGSRPAGGRIRSDGETVWVSNSMYKRKNPSWFALQGLSALWRAHEQGAEEASF